MAFGFLGLLSLQIVVPLILGPAGLFLVVVFDLSLYLAFHRRRGPRTQPRSLVTFGPVDKRYQAHRRDALEADFAATSALIAFMLLLYAVGLVARFEGLVASPNEVLYLIGGIITTLASMVLLPWWGRYVPWGYWARAPESEVYDTVEDH